MVENEVCEDPFAFVYFQKLPIMKKKNVGNKACFEDIQIPVLSIGGWKMWVRSSDRRQPEIAEALAVRL